MDTGDQRKMCCLKKNDLHTSGSAKMGDVVTVLWPCPIVRVHTGFIQAEHINCVIWKAPTLGSSSWMSWANLMPPSPIIKLITVLVSCATCVILLLPAWYRKQRESKWSKEIRQGFKTLASWTVLEISLDDQCFCVQFWVDLKEIEDPTKSTLQTYKTLSAPIKSLFYTITSPLQMAVWEIYIPISPGWPWPRHTQ